MFPGMSHHPDAPRDQDPADADHAGDADHVDDTDADARRPIRTFRQSSDLPYLVLPEDRSVTHPDDSPD